jgi:hypothetical protein
LLVSYPVALSSVSCAACVSLNSRHLAGTATPPLAGCALLHTTGEGFWLVAMLGRCLLSVCLALIPWWMGCFELEEWVLPQPPHLFVYLRQGLAI